MSAPERLAKNSVGTFLSKIVIFSVRFLTGILIARVLGPEGKGLLHILITGVTIGMWLGNLGIGPASIYFIGQDQKHLPALVSNLLVLSGVITVIVLLATGAFFHYGYGVAASHLPFPLWMWIIAALLVPLYILRSLLMQILSAVLRIKEINLINMMTDGIRLLSTLLLIVIWQGGVGGAFLAYAISDAIALSGFFLTVLWNCGRPSKPDFALFIASIRYGLKSHVANLMKFMNLRLDTILVATLATRGIHASGVYSVAANLAELLTFVPESIRLSLFPIISASNDVEANRLATVSCRHTMCLTLICLLGLSILGPFIIHLLYGQEFADAVIPLLILLPGIVMLSQAQVFAGYFMGRGRPGITTIATSLSLIVTIALDLVLIPRYGVIGAATASTCAYGAEFLTSLWFFIRQSRASWQEVLVPRTSDINYYVTFLKSTVKSTSQA